ncbi:ketohydroxyglutarate aldolase [Actinorhabdospora filicis]|uniref:2-dehydro-3-deoxy-phosphogluconate aldolase n=1 Tax=Actinorhabdospora filicis TaxID=1785913 RepID=A0A9W6W345_9ACTN|nr:bifunctional 4-hydroxy-2-oxoglutarate aldolase/2-dehydro-3-deoxy-phosphogluconate aldolase [Actinorhabdospora filicis]GLZ77722.1 ketohydroxyglutarate aldolase [Actinorhabdospora filicis]
MLALDLLGLGPVLPVVVLDRAEDAVPVAEALVAGGVTTMELTLRTPVALAAIEAVAAKVPGIVIGAGTVVSPGQARDAVSAGARFLVSPGSPESLVDAMAAAKVPFLPGVSTATEAMALLARGVTELKLFPASAVGGPALLRALSGPLPQLTFCPTGGITPETAGDYLSLSNVACVGGSWLTPPGLVASGDWAGITALARARPL